MKYEQPVWQIMERCASELPRTVRFDDVRDWFTEHYPGLSEATLRAHVSGLTLGSKSRYPQFKNREPLFRRVAPGEYEVIRRSGSGPQDHEATRTAHAAAQQARAESAPAARKAAGTTRVVLFGINHTGDRRRRPQHGTRARRRFEASRRHAIAEGASWFALSAHYGVVDHDQPIPPPAASLTEADEPHRMLWAAWAVSRLRSTIGPLDGITVVIDAPEPYASLLRPGLAASGAHVTTV